MLFVYILLALIALVLLLLLVHYPLYNHRRKYSFFLASYEKHARISSLGSPKIVFIGDSNVAFGIDSELVEEKIGFPVVNMAISQNLGNYYSFAEVDEYLNEGDIVIFSSVYERFFCAYYGQGKALVKLLEAFPKSYRFMNACMKKMMIRCVPRTIIDSIILIIKMLTGRYKRSTDEIYQRDSFNNHGDMTAHIKVEETHDRKYIEEKLRHRIPLKDRKYPWSAQDIKKNSVRIIEEYFSNWEKRSIKAFLTLTPLETDEYEINRELFDSIYSLFSNKFGPKLLGGCDDFLYPQDAFFDNYHHLKGDSRQDRTMKLIEMLRKTI